MGQASIDHRAVPSHRPNLFWNPFSTRFQIFFAPRNSRGQIGGPGQFEKTVTGSAWNADRYSSVQYGFCWDLLCVLYGSRVLARG